MPTSQYLALHWLSSPLIHHPALDLKERNGINDPAGHTARLPFPLRGPGGSQALHCLYQERFLVGSSPCASWRVGSGEKALVLLPRAQVEAQEIPENSLA